MRSVLLLGTITFGVLLGNAAHADVHVDLAVEIKAFHVGLEGHYKARPGSAEKFHKRGIPNDHLPIVFFIAHHSEVAPERVIEKRIAGMSWHAISIHFGHHAGLFHVDTEHHHGPPYGKALGYYKKYPKHQWSKIKLTDAEIAGLVNVKFMAKKFKCSVDEVIQLHVKGDSFVKLHGKVKIKRNKANAKAKHGARAKPKPSSGSSKPKGEKGSRKGRKG